MLRVAIRQRLGRFELDVDFELPTPGIVALFGRSGCGKTSTVQAIAGLSSPETGRIELDGERLLDTVAGRCVPPERRGIGYVFQDLRLFPHLSVAGNLRYAQRRALDGRRIVGFEEVLELLDLEPLLPRRIERLSGGERQRVAIGRALLSQPRLLLLDEPLAAIDRERRAEVLPYLESLRDRLRLPMVYVSHQFDEVLRLATHVVLMDAGRVIAQGGIGAISLDARLRPLIGPDAVGAVLDGRVIGIDAGSGLARIAVGGGELRLATGPGDPGTAVRVQLLARDVIVATQKVEHTSVRNQLEGIVTAIESDTPGSSLVFIDVGGVAVIARVSSAAVHELELEPGTRAWALVKAASLRAQSFRRSKIPDA
jgi:molybdate transport system ATP-binding protein